mgnify:CR=1 FL=1
MAARLIPIESQRAIAVAILVIGLFGLFLAFYAVLRILAATFGLPQRVRDFRMRRQRALDERLRQRKADLE